MLLQLKNRGYTATIIVLTVLVAAVLAYTIWEYRKRNPNLPKKGRQPPLQSVAGDTSGGGTTKIPAGTPKSTLDKFEEETALARKLVEEKQPLKARKVYEDLLGVTSDTEKVYDEIYRLNMEILFSPLLTQPPDGPQSEIYTVQAGDTVVGIAKKFGTTQDLLMESNNIGDPRTIQIGDRYKVVTDDFLIVVSRSKNTLKLIAGNMVLKEYQVGTGEYQKTPIGDFFIENKIIEPPWKGIPYGDERNVLGTRWMGLRNEDDTIKGYGIHGTWDDSTVGESVSQGCIRLTNPDVEELFKVVPVNTPVKIIE